MQVKYQTAMPRLPAAKLAFKVGDRVRSRRGPAKDELGTVVGRFLRNRIWSISPRPGFVFVVFDRAQGVVVDVAIETLERAPQ